MKVCFLQSIIWGGYYYGCCYYYLIKIPKMTPNAQQLFTQNTEIETSLRCMNGKIGLLLTETF